MESSEDLDSPLHSKHCSYTHSNSSTQTDLDQILPFSLSLPLFLPSSKLQIIYMQRTAHTHTFSPPSLPSFLIHTHTHTHTHPTVDLQSRYLPFFHPPLHDGIFFPIIRTLLLCWWNIHRYEKPPQFTFCLFVCLGAGSWELG